MQAYGVLDKYKISKTFFVKTDQAECAYLDTSTTEESEEPEQEKPEKSEKRKQRPQQTEPNESSRSSIALNNADTEVKKKEEPTAEIIAEKALADIPKIIAEEPVKLEQPIETIPERILKLAETIKEKSDDTRDKMIIVEVREENVAENTKEEKSGHSKEPKATA